MKKLLLLVGFLVSSSCLFAQMYGGSAAMAALNSGEISSLDNVTMVNIIYDYTETGVGAYKKEADYLAKRSKEMNDKKPGTGDKMKENWEQGKKQRYEPRFQDLFTKTGQKIKMSGTNYTTNNEVTLIVKTTFMEPGINIGIYKKPAYVDMECIFRDKAGKDLVAFFIKNSLGEQAMGFDYDVSSRLVESYAKAAKMLVSAIAKERKKAAKAKK
ncbi:MAG: hypothetical protein H7329_02075 [Opitutaceae bacterium]|nr:hypothetical protein [Cytophagales bacterium]